jgi:NADH-quinone oxidoreductase subunit K
MIPGLYHYLAVSFILFAIGAAGVITRRNALVVLMSLEIMLNAVNLAFVTFARFWHNQTGQVFIFFVMAVAAAEVAVGLAIIISIYRSRRTIDIDLVNIMKQ